MLDVSEQPQEPQFTPIDPENIYGTDESGFSEDEGVKIRVIGSRSKKLQHKQGGGNRENTTVIVTICADGTAPRPTVIFKVISLGHSKKGWTDGEIGVEWIKDFHEQTKGKANGCTRLLLVDGHNSHYTLGFLHFARAHRIHVLCYPAHGTHVYQGLDVVIFSPLKRYWTEEKERLFNTAHQHIKKSNFLAVYGRAHLRALTPENIKAAFAKTGVWPYNPNVVTTEMMAPSKETSSQGSLPVPEPSPVRALST
ncbi:DDE-domain-containing protein, partial [Dendrothele bispora CBS 962.96]